MINLIFNNTLGLRVLGWLKIFEAVFIMYPADQEFADYYTFRTRQRLIKWRPFIVGMITHTSGVRTLMFAISAHVDGKDSVYEPEDLRGLHASVEELRTRLGATSTHFAGTIPGRLAILRVHRYENQANEQKATAENVIKAIHFVRGDRLVPVVVLGSRGYVGRKVAEDLKSHNIKTIGVDLGGVYHNGLCVSSNYTQPPDPHVLVNITGPEKANGYIDEMGKNTLFLNEVYPAPHPDVVQAMKEKGVDVRHIAGVKASVWPPFPSAYQGAVPCCAALPGEDYEVLVIKL